MTTYQKPSKPALEQSNHFDVTLAKTQFTAWYQKCLAQQLNIGEVNTTLVALWAEVTEQGLAEWQVKKIYQAFRYEH